MEWLGIIIFGAIIGLLGKFVAPGDKDNTPIWLTVILGIVGAAAGSAIYEAISKDADSFLIRALISIAVAAVLVMIASTLMGRNTTSRSRV